MAATALLAPIVSHSISPAEARQYHPNAGYTDSDSEQLNKQELARIQAGLPQPTASAPAVMPAAAPKRATSNYDGQAYANFLTQQYGTSGAAPAPATMPAPRSTTPAFQQPLSPAAVAPSAVTASRYPAASLPQRQAPNTWQDYQQELVAYQAKYKNSPGYRQDQVDNYLKLAASHLPVSALAQPQVAPVAPTVAALPAPASTPTPAPALVARTLPPPNAPQPMPQPGDETAQRETGRGSFYGPGDGYNGRQTASGTTYNMYEMTAASPDLPFGTMVRVVDRDTGNSVVVEITDRGPARGIIDISYAAALKLRVDVKGIFDAEVIVLDPTKVPVTAQGLRKDKLSDAVTALPKAGHVGYKAVKVAALELQQQIKDLGNKGPQAALLKRQLAEMKADVKRASERRLARLAKQATVSRFAAAANGTTLVAPVLSEDFRRTNPSLHDFRPQGFRVQLALAA